MNLDEIGRAIAETELKEVENALNQIDRYGTMRERNQRLMPLIERRIQLRAALDKFNKTVAMGFPVAPEKCSEPKLPKENKIVEIEFMPESDGTLTFGMVKPGQLFICNQGCLNQKSEDRESNELWEICDARGVPTGIHFEFSDDHQIERILPEIYRIKF